MKVENCKLFINGEWRSRENSYSLKSPYSNKEICKVPIATEDDVNEAVDSAYKNREVMKNLTRYERSNILQRVVEIFKKKYDECVQILILENAKPLSAARQEIDRTIETYQFAAEEAKKIAGEVVPIDAAKNGSDRLGFTKIEPVGVISAITPFNFPFNLVAHKLGPAFATGNTVILKPASQTPLSAYLTVKIFQEAGLPTGALNLIFGSGKEIGKLITSNEKVNLITFTGSVDVGLKIRESSGLKKVILELGSNAAVIIDSTDDIRKVVDRCIEGAYGYSGQTCISLQRIYINEKLYDEFLKLFSEKVENIKVGDPNEITTMVSSLISAGDARRIESWVQEVSRDSIVKGGVRDGSIFSPTILSNVASDLDISCKEVFGPVAIVNKYSSLKNTIKEVNNSAYGMQYGIYTTSIETAFKSLDSLEAGGVIINDIPSYRVDNMPYGGIKNSGVGKEGVKYSMEEMVEKKLCLINLN